MELRGCSGCSGFSYTEKYKQSMVDFAEWIYINYGLGTVKYQEVQKLIEEGGGCKDSETRMIVPFMIKSGIINKEGCEFHGSRLFAINTKDVFTKAGEAFIQFLKVEIGREKIPNSLAKDLIQEIYEKFAKIQFYHLFNSDEPIYKEMVQFLLDYLSMDETEFFMLSTAMQDNTKSNLGSLISRYRNQEYENAELNIVYNVNAYSYTSKLLIQYNLFMQRGNSIVLNPKYEVYFRRLIEDEL